jgi:hypothetical protein
LNEINEGSEEGTTVRENEFVVSYIIGNHRKNCKTRHKTISNKTKEKQSKAKQKPTIK